MSRIFQRASYFFRARDRTLELGKITRVMGVLNVTPDSFSGDGLILAGRQVPQQALRIARRMIASGADIIDVGGESTRPGAVAVRVSEEIKRVIPVVSLLVKNTDAMVSVDTYKPEVAAAALEVGAHILNVIKGVPVSNEILRLCKRYHAGIVLMHMRGTPASMQRRTVYRDVVAEVAKELKKSVEKCLRFGFNKEAILVDPGIGFAKTANQNLALLNDLPEFARIHCPLLIGTSRKSFIGNTLGLEVSQRSWGTAATVACSIMGGAHIIRVHDVAPMKHVAVMTDAIINKHIEPAI